MRIANNSCTTDISEVIFIHCFQSLIAQDVWIATVQFKFKSANNKIDRPISRESRRVASKMKLGTQDAACFQDRESWKNEDKQGESSVHSLAGALSKNSYKDDSLRESDDSSQE